MTIGIFEFKFLCISIENYSHLKNIFSKNNLEIKNTFCSSVVRSFNYINNFKNEKCVAFLDIGFLRSSLILFKKGSLHLFKNIPVGGQSITKDISYIMKIDLKDSEEIKHLFNKSETDFSYLNEIKHEAIPLWFLLVTPILVLISIPISFYLFISNPKVLGDFKNTNMPLYNFLLNKWYIDELYEKVFVIPTKKIGSFFWKKGDIGLIDKFGPDGISKLVKIISSKTGRLQTGFIYDYAFVMLLGLSVLLTYLILK